jgi:hypothetical protein
MLRKAVGTQMTNITGTAGSDTLTGGGNKNTVNITPDDPVTVN